MQREPGKLTLSSPIIPDPFCCHGARVGLGSILRPVQIPLASQSRSVAWLLLQKQALLTVLEEHLQSPRGAIVPLAAWSVSDN